ncbi:MAG: hypothetical protein H6553_12525 [Chitinophagales bacterium]|nr:hypothetical protein [Chitinophagales bacterium]
MAFATGEPRTSGARQVGMGMNSISLVSVYSVYNNQAASAFIERPSIGFYYSPVFVGQGVNNISSVMAFPAKKAGTFGLSFGYFGYDAFNEKKLGLSYAIKLAKFMSIGMQLDWLNTQIVGYGSKNAATFELGILAKPLKELSIAAHIYNPVKIYLDDANTEKVPTVLKFGATYEAVKKFFVSIELEQQFGEKMRFRAGFDYTYKEIISFRGGVSTDPPIGTAGVGVNLKQGLHIDFATSYSQVLGFQPHVGIWYELKKRKKIPK